MPTYKKFQKIDGTHPWRTACPDGYIDYPARYRKGGRVLYFNFNLAREMGLISQKHPNKVNPKLEKAILETFSLLIINEHDQVSGESFPEDSFTGKRYMATRYLQSQHDNKRGTTSGDGRSIWNGYIRSNTMAFDVSSRGTGTTALSPGAQESKEPIKTGDETYGYSSGLADLDEMLASAILSEIFYREHFPTERCLTVIDYPDKTSVGVRVAPNLIRPAHIFRYLKSDSWEGTKASFDYLVKRQTKNKIFKFSLREKSHYKPVLDYLAKTYAKLAATMEEEYIFNWLYWDGDNMLASGGILDYGSIRRFAAKHSKYRYEDVDRFSTSLNEQRYWTRVVVQTFAQTIDFIRTKKRKNLKSFEDHPVLKVFDKAFEEKRQKALLWRMGFTPEHIHHIREHHQNAIKQFSQILCYFEDLKTTKGQQAVPDGIDHPPIFLIRHIMRELPAFLLKNFTPHICQDSDDQKLDGGEWSLMPVEQFCRMMAASYVNRADLELTDVRKLKAIEFQELYQQLIRVAGKDELKTLKTVADRSAVINYAYRCTGDGLTWIVQEIIKSRDKMKRAHIHEVIERVIESQVLVPNKWKPLKSEELKGNSKKSELLKKVQGILEEYKENI